MRYALLNKYIDWPEHYGDVSLQESSYNKLGLLSYKLLYENYCDWRSCTSQYVFGSERDVTLKKNIISKCLIVQCFVFVVDNSKQIIL